MYFLTAAAPPAADPAGLVRRANAAFLRGDAPAADALYAAAAERTGDPGLVAFNKAAVFAQQGDFPAAELHYARALSDPACPPARAARAWFNRGTCLLRRGGGAAVFRSAVGCFDQCLDSPAADEPLKADARHNLELAKLLWAEANAKAAKPDSPNVPPPEVPSDEPPPAPGGTDPQPPTTSDDGNTGPKTTRPAPATNQPPVAKAGQGTATRPTPGNNPNLQPLPDTADVQPQPPDVTREYLRQTEARLREEQRSLRRLLAGPDRPGVRDW